MRLRILDAGLEVFSQSGYRHGSLREIAEHVGMSEGGLLYHFPTKSALLAAVLEHRDAYAEEIIRGGDGRVSLAGLVELARYNATQPGVVELFCVLSAEATTPDHPAHDFFVARYDRLRQRIADTLRQARAQGALREGIDPDRAAVRLIAVWDGLQVQWLLDRSCVDVAADLADHIHAVLDIRLPGW